MTVRELALVEHIAWRKAGSPTCCDREPLKEFAVDVVRFFWPVAAYLLIGWVLA